MFVLDISENNGEVDFDALVEHGVEGVIIRSSYGKYSEDECFYRNVEEAVNHGLKVGAYHYSYALDEEDAILEAHNMINVLARTSAKFELGIWFDMEDADSYKDEHDFDFEAANITNICKAFIDNMPYDNKGIYASYSWFEYYIDYRYIGCNIWNAQWGEQDDLSPISSVWQYSSEYYIDGNVFDANEYYEEGEHI